MQQLPTVLAHHGCWSITRSYCVAVYKETNCKMRVLGPIGVERSVQTDPTWLLYASVTIACEQQTHFRSALLSLRKRGSDDRKCVCCSQVTATTEQKKCWELLAQNWFQTLHNNSQQNAIGCANGRNRYHLTIMLRLFTRGLNKESWLHFFMPPNLYQKL